MRVFSSGGLCLEEIKETKSYCGFKLFEFIQIQVRSPNPSVAYWVVMRSIFSKKKKKMNCRDMCGKKCLWAGLTMQLEGVWFISVGKAYYLVVIKSLIKK